MAFSDRCVYCLVISKRSVPMPKKTETGDSEEHQRTRTLAPNPMALESHAPSTAHAPQSTVVVSTHEQGEEVTEGRRLVQQARTRQTEHDQRTGRLPPRGQPNSKPSGVYQRPPSLSAACPCAEAEQAPIASGP